MDNSNELVFDELKRGCNNDKYGIQQSAEKKRITPNNEVVQKTTEENNDAVEQKNSVGLITELRNVEKKLANADWCISKKLSYESAKRHFDDSDDKAEPEIWHLNRPGKGKQMAPEMLSNSEDDSDSSDASLKLSKRIKMSDEAASFENCLVESRPIRSFKKIPIFIADYHNDVMVFIYRAIATRHLPLYENVLLHFDSHPDMVVSSELFADTCFDKQKLLNELSIENWIIPACFSGQFGRIIWLKNSWSKQLDKGSYEFNVGSINNKLGVDMPQNYFVAEGSYYKTEQLMERRNIKLDVYEMDTQKINAANLLDVSEDANRCILDIDLDFFSTTNPFLDIYPLVNCYEQLKSIFKFEACDDLEKVSEYRRRQLDAFHDIFQHLKKYRTLPNYPVLDEVITSEIFKLIEKLHSSLCEIYDENTIDWLQIFNAGCTIDDIGLPHHLSSAEELEKHYERFKQFLLSLPFPPVCVTIACSAEDNYTPPEQMESILENVLKILQEVYADKINHVPIRYDDTHNFNIYNL